MESRVVVEVLAPQVGSEGRPRPGRRATASGDPTADDASFRLYRLLDRLREVFGGQVVVYLVEPLSLPWIVRMVRFRPSRYPAFIVDGRAVVAGLDESTLLETVATCLRMAAGAGAAGPGAAG